MGIIMMIISWELMQTVDSFCLLYGGCMRFLNDCTMMLDGGLVVYILFYAACRCSMSNLMILSYCGTGGITHLDPHSTSCKQRIHRKWHLLNLIRQENGINKIEVSTADCAVELTPSDGSSSSFTSSANLDTDAEVCGRKWGSHQNKSAWHMLNWCSVFVLEVRRFETWSFEGICRHANSKQSSFVSSRRVNNKPTAPP